MMDSQDDYDARTAKPFVEHLDDLRKTIIWILAAIFCGVLIAFPLVPHIITFFKAPLVRAGYDPAEFLRIISLTDGFMLGMKTAFWTGLFISFPVVTGAVLFFVFPGLTRREKRGVKKALVCSAVLFFAGAVLCYCCIISNAIRLLLQFNAWLGVSCRWIEMGNYTSFVLKLLIAFGLAFELPVVLVTLGNFGIVNSEQLRKYRRHSIVAILIVAMVLTPPDVFTQVVMAGPMIVLYEICIWLVRAGEKRRSSDTSSPV